MKNLLPSIQIREGVIVCGNHGVMIDKRTVDMDPGELHDAIKLAFHFQDNEYLMEANCGGHNLLNDQWGSGEDGAFTLEEFQIVCREIEHRQALHEATRNAKRHDMKHRRSQFSAVRSELVLAMISSGKPYVCSHPECEVMSDLTVDHIVPIVKGGSDSLDNLQFMCRSHNSQKRDMQIGT